MAKRMYPLLFKGGIKRDNTPFQGEYITDGDYVRWIDSYLRKMTGVTSFNLKDTLKTQYFKTKDNILQYFYFFTIQSQTDKILSIVFKEKNNILYSKFNTNNNFIAIDKPINICEGEELTTAWDNTLPQIVPISYYGEKADSLKTSKLIFYLGQNLNDINDPSTTPDNIYILDFPKEPLEPLKLEKANIFFNQDTVNPSVFSGGVLLNKNYLFFYGSDGTIIVSQNLGIVPVDAPRDAFNFVDKLDQQSTSGKMIKISDDKIIYGAVTRGSSDNSYSMLFWTISSLILVESFLLEGLAKDQKTQITQLDWNSTIISTNTSILSNRCVVENNGLFYWIGTDGFYVYNGMVQPLSNNLNRYYFFNNLDMSKRQLVHGVLNEKFNEIWWFYPEKINTSQNYNIDEARSGIAQCTRAIIFNLKEQTWYDVALNSTHAQYIPLFGQVAFCGIPKNFPYPQTYLQLLDSSPEDIILNIDRDNLYIERNLQGISFSVDEEKEGNEGGGIAEYAFDNNYLTNYEATTNSEEIRFFYINPPKILTNIGLLYQGTKNKIDYDLNIFGLNQNNEKVEITNIKVKLIKGQIYWIATPEVRYYGYGIANRDPKAPGTVPLNFNEIYFYTKITDNEQTQIKAPIISYFTTPIVSFATFSAVKNNEDGEDVWFKISRIEPDFKSINDISFSMRINSKTYALSEVLTSEIFTIDKNTDFITTVYQGRNLTFSFSTIQYLEFGNFFFKGEKGAVQ